MSCCVIEKNTTSNAKELNELRKHFDEVLIEKKEKYQVLTIRDKANKPNYDYVVWLEIKVSNGYQKGYSKKTDEEMLQKVCRSILDWIDALEKYKKPQVKQLSLFGDDNNELEQEPEMPTDEHGWNSYHKKCEEIRKRNLIKQYSFLDLLDIEYYVYSGIDWRKFLPSIEEVKELYKQAILKGMHNPGRYDDFWFNSPGYLARDGALSDRELKARITSTIRLFLLPFKNYQKGHTDLSYAWHSLDWLTVNYRYYLNGSKLSTNSHHDNDKLNLPSYDGVFDDEFLEWVRQTMGIEKTEVISDDDVLRNNIKNFFSRLIGYEAFEKYDFEHKINTFKNWKQFKADILPLKPESNNGGGSGYSLDGFSGSIYIDGKGKIEITQDIDERIELGRSIDGLETYDYGNNAVYVFKLSGDEIYKKAFELFNKKVAVKQTSLFDFLAA